MPIISIFIKKILPLFLTTVLLTASVVGVMTVLMFSVNHTEVNFVVTRLGSVCVSDTGDVIFVVNREVVILFMEGLTVDTRDVIFAVFCVVDM